MEVYTKVLENIILFNHKHNIYKMCPVAGHAVSLRQVWRGGYNTDSSFLTQQAHRNAEMLFKWEL